ncbi:hypothetical protein [Massilia scottii]|uniref:hypothetical protein n=1 Tax=Massilia scottii TaxID=3057166 RepID=UPI0006BB62B7|nr:hypothetical protein [Massilia sp. CCM 9029]MDQ1834091.1 hypothetical protein [Massilia sp. CCM 9029]
MMAPTKRQRKAPKLVARAAVTLTPAEQRMLELFRATRDQEMLLSFAGVFVETAPRHIRPVLHLVRGGAA